MSVNSVEIPIEEDRTPTLPLLPDIPADVTTESTCTESDSGDNVTNNPQTAASVAVSEEFMSAVRSMCNHSTSTSSVDSWTACNNATKLQDLLDKGATVNYKDDAGNGVLHVAAFKDHPEIMDTLLRLDPHPDVNALNAAGESPMHIAVQNHSPQCVELLHKASCGHVLHNASCDLPPVMKSMYESMFDASIKPVTKVFGTNDGYELNFKSVLPTPEDVDPENIPESRLIHQMSRREDFAVTIQHPLVTAFVTLKISQMWFIQFTCLAFATCACAYSFAFSAFYGRCLFSIPENVTASDYTLPQYWDDGKKCYDSLTTFKTMWIVWLTVSAFSLMFELSQLRMLGRKYLRDIANWLDMINILSACICSPYLITYIPQVQKAICVLVMISSSLNVMLCFFKDNVSVMMFRQAILTVCSFIFPYTILLAGFIVVFGSIYPKAKEFDAEGGYAILSVFIMLLGNLDSTTKGLGSNNDFTIVLAVVLFSLLVLIVMFNLLTGVMVEKVQGQFKDSARSEIMKNRINRIYNMELMLQFATATAYLFKCGNLGSVFNPPPPPRTVIIYLDRSPDVAWSIYLWLLLKYQSSLTGPNTGIMEINSDLLNLNSESMDHIEQIVQLRKNSEKLDEVTTNNTETEDSQLKIEVEEVKREIAEMKTEITKVKTEVERMNNDMRNQLDKMMDVLTSLAQKKTE